MTILENISLKPYNTFHINIQARKAVFIDTPDELIETLQTSEVKKNNYLILGGGSNVLFVNDFDGLVIFPEITGISVIQETAEHVLVEAGAGEDWDDFVAYTVEKGWAGLENLSLIPGHVGASPIQNIGAYGVEAGQVIEKVHVLEINTGKKYGLSNNDCGFGYRSSIFKYAQKGRFVITSVVYRLHKNLTPNIGYGNLADEIQSIGSNTLGNIRQAVINIRNSKLPDPEKLGNAGSFFKNPEISSDRYDSLRKKYPDIPGFPVGDRIKIPAAFLIDRCGWKGYTKGDAGVHQNQPLVLVNYGKATGFEILKLAESIQKSVSKTFDIDLEMEVNVI